MNRFLILLLVFIYAYHAQSTTIPGGNVSGTWTQAGSPYYINGDITVPASATLIIQPGTRVIFNNTYGITVDGKITCTGTASDSIFFSSLNTNINWKGININGSSLVQDSMMIRYCVFSNMLYGVLAFDFDYLALKNCRFYKNVLGFMESHYSNALSYSEVTDNLFHNNNNTVNANGYRLLLVSSRSKVVNNVFRGNVNGCLRIMPSTANDTALIQHNVFDNPRGTGGNAVTIDQSPVYVNAKFSDNVFKNNSSTYNYSSPGWGAILLNGNYTSFERDSFLNNVTATGAGGAIYMIAGKLRINDCYFKGNSAVRTGVGAYGDIYAQNYSTISINNTTFDRSPKKSIYAGNNSTLSINRCQFTNGSETIIYSPSIIKVTNTLFANNNGYIILAGDQGELTVGNCTFANNINSSGGYCKGIFAYNLYKLNIYNSVFWGCPSGTCGYDIYIDEPLSMTSTISVKNCDIQGGLANVYVSGTTIGTATNNINVNPSFTNPAPTTGTLSSNSYDYSLMASSPLINKGTPDTTGLKLGNLDLQGSFRIMSDTVDIGAYETPRAPMIRQAQTTFTYCEHANTSISIPVAGATPLVYKWLRGTNTLTNTSNALSFVNIAAADTGYYSFIVTNTYGSDTVTLHIRMNPLPVVSFSAPQPTVCVNSPTIALSGGTPLNGTYSGPGVTNTTFNPSLAGAGNHQIIYTYTNSSGCSNSDAKTFQVNPSPAVSFTVPQSTFCVSSPSIALSAGTPAGGVYSGPGVNSTSFDPAVAGVGNHQVVYSYTNSLGCSSSDSKTFQVSALPVVSFATSQNTFCINSPTVALSGGTPLSGIYSGPGVTANNFNPTTAGVGNHQIVYTYTNSAGCSSSNSKIFQVNALPVVSFATSQNTFCINSPTVALSGGTPLSGTYSGPGVTTNNFNPTTAGAGNHQIVYTYTNGAGCSSNDSKMFQVSALPVVSFATSQNTFCINSSTVALSGGTPLSGTYSGPGVTTNNFNPTSAGVGNHQIIYTYTNSAGCSNSDSETFQVSALPVVSFTTSPLMFCLNSASLALSGGLPLSGTYSGTGVTNNSFDPAIAGAGNHQIIYTYTNSAGCSDSDSETFQVSLCTGMETLSLESNELSIYPNPNDGNFTISGPDLLKNLRIINVLGEEVFYRDHFASPIYVVQSLNLSPGIYHVMIRTEAAAYLKRIVIQ